MSIADPQRIERSWAIEDGTPKRLAHTPQTASTYPRTRAIWPDGSTRCDRRRIDMMSVLAPSTRDRPVDVDGHRASRCEVGDLAVAQRAVPEIAQIPANDARRFGAIHEIDPQRLGASAPPDAVCVNASAPRRQLGAVRRGRIARRMGWTVDPSDGRSTVVVVDDNNGRSSDAAGENRDRGETDGDRSHAASPRILGHRPTIRGGHRGASRSRPGDDSWPPGSGSSFGK